MPGPSFKDEAAPKGLAPARAEDRKMTADTIPYSHPLRVADLATRKPTRFDLKPDATTCNQIAASLGLLALDKLRFAGEIRPQGGRDWLLEATLGATVTQACVVTLAPVTNRIEEDVTRHYLADMPEPEGEEVEMPEDDSVEALTDVIDPGAVLIEALALSLPLYPRADGAELGTARFAEPGAEPLSDEALKPFAGLADLLKKGDDTA